VSVDVSQRELSYWSTAAQRWVLAESTARFTSALPHETSACKGARVVIGFLFGVAIEGVLKGIHKPALQVYKIQNAADLPPRIRGVQHQRIYRIDPNRDYGSLTSLFSRSDQIIDTEQIAEQWDRMGQLYASLKIGHVTAPVP
jgi:hypothetical protein